MKTHYLVSGGENDDIFRSMMSFLDSLELTDEAQIYINSGGGACWLYETILTRLNEMVEQGYKITLRIIFIGSMAFDTAYNFKGTKRLEDRADGIIHIEATEVHVWRNKIRENDNTERERIKWNDQKEQNMYPFLTEKEIEDYLDGRDIYINPDRMREIFK